MSERDRAGIFDTGIVYRFITAFTRGAYDLVVCEK